MGLPAEILTDIENALHPIRNAVINAVKAAEAKAEADKAALAQAAKDAVANVEAAAKADAPEIEAALKKGAADALAALEAVLAAHGL